MFIINKLLRSLFYLRMENMLISQISNEYYVQTIAYQ